MNYLRGFFFVGVQAFAWAFCVESRSDVESNVDAQISKSNVLILIQKKVNKP